jgi:hypothetical protein
MFISWIYGSLLFYEFYSSASETTCFERKIDYNSIYSMKTLVNTLYDLVAVRWYLNFFF